MAEDIESEEISVSLNAMSFDETPNNALIQLMRDIEKWKKVTSDKTGPITPDHDDHYKKKFVELVGLTYPEELMDYLFQDSLLTTEQREIIGKAQSTKDTMRQILMNCMGSERGYYGFLRAYHMCQYDLITTMAEYNTPCYGMWEKSKDPEMPVKTLSPSITSISALCSLILARPSEDFSIAENIPEDSFIYTKHPKSFQACLTQITNEVHEAYKAADDGMAAIFYLSEDIPKKVTNTMKVCKNASQGGKIVLLQDCLKELQSMLKTVGERVTNIKDKFDKVICLIDEIQEILDEQKKTHYSEAQHAKREHRTKQRLRSTIEEQKEQKQQEATYLDDLIQFYKRAMQTMVDLHKKYESIHSKLFFFCWDYVKLNFGSFFKAVFFFLQILWRGLSYLWKKNPDRVMSFFIILGNKDCICNAFQYIEGILNPLPVEKKDWENIKDGTKDLKDCKLYFTVTSNELEKEGISDNKIAFEYVALLSMGAELCQNIISAAEGQNVDKNELWKLKNEAEHLWRKSMLLHDCVSNVILSEKNTKSQTPTTHPDIDDEFLRILGKDPNVKRQNMKHMLKDLQNMEKKYTTLSEDLEKLNEDEEKVEADISRLEASEKDHENIRHILIAVKKALSRMKEEWIRFDEYISLVSSKADSKLICKLQTMQGQLENILMKESANRLILEMFSILAKDSVPSAQTFHHIAGTYVSVSKQYLLGSAGRLCELISLDSGSEQQEVQSRCHAMMEDCTKARSALKMVINQKRMQFLQDISEETARIEGEMRINTVSI